MSIADRWLLPDGVKEILPAEARRVEALRRRLLDLFDCWGYDLVMPPMVEYLESLLTGTGNDLDLSTFKVTDQLTGRMMGLRADTTPQVARIDAHSLNHQGPTRLCYANSVLHTVPATLQAGRSPLQVGAELYGHAGVESDIEVVCLMLEALAAAGVEKLTLDLGHVAIYRSLVAEAGLNADDEAELFRLLQGKAMTELGELLARLPVADAQRERLKALCRLSGDQSVLAAAQQSLGDDSGVAAALADLAQVAAAVTERFPAVTLYFDLAELRGYNYHTGLVFAVYVPEYGQAVAKGGRYDQIGKVFGRARPATGFSADLKVIVEMSCAEVAPAEGVLAPVSDCAALARRVNELRVAGERVVCALPGAVADAVDMGCNRQLVEVDGNWVVKAV
ncbi:ATP phosphoribosyltransferase regulatory subunit [Motiliproteus sediminis]|uniref:ATP phosphoribosyltransferase regulatory subunit n=1 Tax=Motiliproteus sediminis TaxID=1468178 RepID=UPI001AEF894C|nr:ATP phosphoribosyltransferase regulatory subunit [Motiliproteus sediminis]